MVPGRKTHANAFYARVDAKRVRKIQTYGCTKKRLNGQNFDQDQNKMLLMQSSSADW